MKKPISPFSGAVATLGAMLALGPGASAVAQSYNPGAPVSLTNPMPVQLAASVPVVWTTGTTAQDARGYGSVTIQVSGLSGGDAISVTGSVDGVNYAALTGIDTAFNLATSITTNGIYRFSGGQYLKWAQTGSASAPTITIRAGS